MNKIPLTSKEKFYLEQRHKDGKQKTERERIKAVLRFSEGWSTTMLSQATKLSYEWIRKGETKLVNTGGSRTRMNLIGVIDLVNIDEPQVSEYTIENADAIIDFMTDLKKS